VGSPYSQAYNYLFPFLYVQHRSEKEGQETVWPAIIEAYQGRPAVASARLLEIRGNEQDALRAVAVEVKTTGGHTDVCYAGGRPDKLRDLPGGIRAGGQFAFLSHDDKGLRQAVLVGGSLLAAQGLMIRPQSSGWTGRITAVDYAAMEATLDTALPASAIGQELYIHNDLHHTHYTIAAVRPRGGGSTVSFTRSAEIGRGELRGIKGQAIELSTGPFNGHEFANRNAGYTVTTEGGKSRWQVASTWNKAYTLTGAVPKQEQFDDADGDGRITARFYDYGPGDAFALPSHVVVTRDEDGTYAATADTPAQITVAGRNVEVQNDTGKRD
jgi:hypothetical protein